ncbi:Serine/threonine kinase [Podochytrium sp. JEL0797]|nr:Serine/threonine kinase [Podochytrium sp. JEL0797]
MGNAVDKVLTSINRNVSFLSIRSSFGSGLGSRSMSNMALSGPPEVSSFVQEILSDFDFCRCETPMTSAKLAFRLHHVETKLRVETKVAAGTERMCQVLIDSPQQVDEKRARQVEQKLIECRERCALLTQTVQKYKGLRVDEKELPPLPDDEDTEDVPFPVTNPTLSPVSPFLPTHHPRAAVSGRLKLTLVGCSNLLPTKLSPSSSTSGPARLETYAVFRIDSAERGRTRASRSKWMDAFDVPIEKGYDIEISVHEKHSGALLGVVWFAVSELDVMLKGRKEKRVQEMLFMAAQQQQQQQQQALSEKVDRRHSFAVEWGSLGRTGSMGKVTEGGRESGEEGKPLTPSSPLLNASSVLYDGENVWLDLEPAGQISLKINFLCDTERVKKNVDGLLLRSKPVQKVLQKRGHKFIAAKFSPVMKCAVCQDFLLFPQGYQCQACKYTCHKKCEPRVPINCITLTSLEQQQAHTQHDQVHRNHHIPHRWEETLNLGAPVAWCAHCGYMLPTLSRKECRRCGECGVAAHTNCALLVPDACGLTVGMVEAMRVEVERAEKAKWSKEVAEERAKVEAVRKEEERVKGQMEQMMAGGGAGGLAVKPVSVATVVSTTSHSTKRQRVRPVGLDDFTFLAVLGKGNFGKVMLAEEKVTGNHYAIKVLKKDFIIESDEVEATRSEKRVFLTASLERFPFLVNLHSCFQTESRLYFVMEFVSGGDLMWHIQQRHFTAERAKYYACEVLLALEYFHKNDIIYRDLKLDNILLTLDGHVKIADYGLCKEKMPYGATTTTFCGTPEFMSPEILLEKPYTRTVDWWSYGVLIYELLLGAAPFKGKDEDQIFDSILHKDPSFPFNTDPDAVDLIQRLLCKTPEKRLGAGVSDAEEIKAHRWFRDVNWQDVLDRKNPPPFVPAITSATDVSNFDSEFTNEMPVLTPCKNTLAAVDQEEFRGFTHMSEWAQKERVARKSEAGGGSGVHR